MAFGINTMIERNGPNVEREPVINNRRDSLPWSVDIGPSSVFDKMIEKMNNK